MNARDIEALQEVKEATIRAKDLVRSITESLDNAGRFTESGRSVEHRHGTPLEWRVHALLESRVEYCIANVQRTVVAGWAEPTEFNLSLIKGALVNLEDAGRTLVAADALRSLVGQQEPYRLIALELRR